MSFVLVTASRDEGFISAVIAEDEWQKLFELAEALPNNLTWTAQAHEGAGHRSESTVSDANREPEQLGAEDAARYTEAL